MTRPRALLLFGAGASLDYGAPSTTDLTEMIRNKVMSDEWMRSIGGDRAYNEIQQGLASYLSGPEAVNFEHIYHVAHELAFLRLPTPHAMDEFRPLLVPFVRRSSELEEGAYRNLCYLMASTIYETISEACACNDTDLGPLAVFLNGLRESHITRIYTTNYDDFILQAAPDLYTGFLPTRGSEPRKLDSDGIWRMEDADSLFHLHGSVHLCFPHPKPESSELSELYWIEDREGALRAATYHGDDERRMDGTGFIKTSIITGLDKLSRLQRKPMSHYYASFARDAMLADLIVIVGSGLTDLHLNSWLSQARSSKQTPLVFVDFWNPSFLRASLERWGRKEMALFHQLHVHAKGPFGGERFAEGWTMAPGRTAAIWDRGLRSFLADPQSFQTVLEILGDKPQRPLVAST